MIARSRHGSLLAVLTLMAALTALAMTVGAQNASSASYSSCSLSESDRDPPGHKPEYNLSLKQKNTSCTTAKKVMKSFHSCRSAAGYRCPAKVRTHWTCSGEKGSSTSQLFHGSFTCRWGNRRVKSSYQQNT